MSDDLAAFAQRHIGWSSSDRDAMLEVIGSSNVGDLMDTAVPSSIRSAARGKSSIPPAATEAETLRELRDIASLNRVTTSMIGLGYYGTYTPAVIQRNVLENPSWYTAYTPYQPEISQGRLEALINFQTMIVDLTGLDVANASMLDESTAVVEAMLLARRATKGNAQVFLVDDDALPQTKRLLEHRAAAVGITLRYTSFDRPNPIMASAREVAGMAESIEGVAGAQLDDAELSQQVDGNGTRDTGHDGQQGGTGRDADVFGAFIQYPGATGRLWDPREAIAAVHAAGGLAVVSADLLALCVLVPPGELGADIAVGTSQRFGVPMGFGGPHAGYLAVKQGLVRQMPGRLVGVSVDADGHPAYRLSLQTREQHIRRDKATSNICTAQVLLAVMAAMYAVYHGPEGLRAIATGVADRTRLLADLLTDSGIGLAHDRFFDTVRLVDVDASTLFARLRDIDVTALVVDDATLQLSIDETIDEATIRNVARTITGAPQSATRSATQNDTGALQGGATVNETSETPSAVGSWPADLLRTSEYLTHPTFHSYRSETAMMRYLKRLADLDYALDRGMIPLGSCTMKLNAATEMQAITWPEFAGLHPFAPPEDAAGYQRLIGDLEAWLAEITGYDAVSLQPNAGSQGELAGLLAIRGFHRANGDDERTVCLIPSSAHGTNAASAVLAGMRVVVVACDEMGNVDLDDLAARIAENAETLAALMITYPSTHGVYEQHVRAICDAVHAAGGQVYIDGANLNAIVGYARFGEFGGDVSHLNLHKTFAIPHGGGGPGVGPVGAKAHLAPFLPRAEDSVGPRGGKHLPFLSGDENPVSGAPVGSASILPISWAYIRLMGEQGLRDATAAAVLSANYVAARLRDSYPILYTGESGLVAHECILDLRPLKDATGITVDDVAKRLIDYGFHAPTMSFPVAGTLMVEPTESEDIGELDRFIAAMIAIKAEAGAVAAGQWPADDNPLVNAPHTAQRLAGEWSHPYSRQRAVFPVPGMVRYKYWPPVARIDQAWGDRNLACTCPPVEAFA